VAQDGLIAKLAQLIALYVVYVFLSGWAFFDHYYREFGADPRWFDLPLQETLVKGFTILFSNAFSLLSIALWAIYLLMIGVPLWGDGTKHRDHLWVRFSVGGFMVAALISVYFLSAHAGLSAARSDQGAPTRLALATFSLKSCVERREAKEKGSQEQIGRHNTPKSATAPKAAEQENCDYSGQILIFRNSTYYMYKVAALRQQPEKTLELRVFRAEDLADLHIAGEP
jgi:hypothetical protein